MAVRINSDLPTVTPISINDPQGVIEYQLLSIPFYLIGQLPRLLAQI